MQDGNSCSEEMKGTHLGGQTPTPGSVGNRRRGPAMSRRYAGWEEDTVGMRRTARGSGIGEDPVAQEAFTCSDHGITTPSGVQIGEVCVGSRGRQRSDCAKP